MATNSPVVIAAADSVADCSDILQAIKLHSQQSEARHQEILRSIVSWHSNSEALLTHLEALAQSTTETESPELTQILTLCGEVKSQQDQANRMLESMDSKLLTQPPSLQPEPSLVVVQTETPVPPQGNADDHSEVETALPLSTPRKRNHVIL